jgi:hypothetical protein
MKPARERRANGRRDRAVLAVGLIAILRIAAACEDTSPPIPCVDAPPTGCPEDFGADVCQDPRCDSVYACTDGHWVFARACGARDGAGAPDATGVDADSGGDRDGPPGVDAPMGAFGGPGCVSLQAPDCDLGVALVCSTGVDCCGCQDLFVCVDGGWEPWGTCTDGGVVPR